MHKRLGHIHYARLNNIRKLGLIFFLQINALMLYVKVAKRHQWIVSHYPGWEALLASAHHERLSFNQSYNGSSFLVVQKNALGLAAMYSANNVRFPLIGP